MKKPIIFSLFFFILTAISSFGQGIGVWVEETVDPTTGLRTGKIEVNGELFEIKPNVTITSARLWRADLRNANLRGAVLDGARLVTTNLEGANLSGASLRGANLDRANLTRANITNADLEGANLTEADFTEVEIGDVGRAMLDLSNKIAIEQLNSDVEAIKAQLQTLVAQVAEKDAKIAELEKRPTIEQVRDARAGSVVLTVEPDGNNITLGLTIEQSDNLIEWKNLEGEITRTIPIPDGKKFYRFALDK